MEYYSFKDYEFGVFDIFLVVLTLIILYYRWKHYNGLDILYELRKWKTFTKKCIRKKTCLTISSVSLSHIIVDGDQGNCFQRICFHVHHFLVLPPGICYHVHNFLVLPPGLFGLTHDLFTFWQRCLPGWLSGLLSCISGEIYITDTYLTLKEDI